MANYEDLRPLTKDLRVATNWREAVHFPVVLRGECVYPLSSIIGLTDQQQTAHEEDVIHKWRFGGPATA